MANRLLRIERCGQCPYRATWRTDYCKKDKEKRDVNRKSVPLWCPLPLANEAAEPLAMILVRTIVAEWRRTGTWAIDPDLQGLLIELANGGKRG